mmetsp:Transcript_15835/g.36665  ORF Transcript_15835/g.36665 Transcript_15835/m.36665 type:complete len:81 (+) Transcript_15835:152-394(+)
MIIVSKTIHQLSWEELQHATQTNNLESSMMEYIDSLIVVSCGITFLTHPFLQTHYLVNSVRLGCLILRRHLFPKSARLHQ